MLRVAAPPSIYSQKSAPCMLSVCSHYRENLSRMCAGLPRHHFDSAIRPPERLPVRVPHPHGRSIRLLNYGARAKVAFQRFMPPRIALRKRRLHHVGKFKDLERVAPRAVHPRFPLLLRLPHPLNELVLPEAGARAACLGLCGPAQPLEPAVQSSMYCMLCAQYCMLCA